MNFYIWAFIVTVSSFPLLFLWLKPIGLKEVKHPFLYVILTIPLCPIVNLYIKRPIFNWLYDIFNMNRDISLWTLWFLAIVHFISPLTEEGIKILPLVLAFVRKNLKEKGLAFTSGFLLGSGFGLGEAWFLAYAFSNRMPELAYGSFNYLLGFFGERIGVVFIHASFTALVLLGFFFKRPIRYYFAAVFSHALVNVGAALFQSGKVSSFLASLIIIISALFIFILIAKIIKGIRKEKPIEEKIYFKRD